MHRILVDEKKWVEESRYLHALNFCMLLPGPEAQKLATYVGWLLHGMRGGLAAGILFVLPGALVMLAISLLYVLGRGVPVIDGALFGIKAAVLVIVVEALIRIGRRSLKTRLLVGLAGLAFVGIFFLDLSFPLIVAAAAAVGYLAPPALLGLKDGTASRHRRLAGPLAARCDRFDWPGWSCGGRQSRWPSCCWAPTMCSSTSACSSPSSPW